MKSKLILLVVILLLGGLGTSYYIYFNKSNSLYRADNCVFEIKTCPDGSGVTRVGKSCDFAKCPTEKNVAPVTEISEPIPAVSTSTTPTTTSTFSKTVPEAPKPKIVTPPQTPTKTTKASFIGTLTNSVSSFFKSVEDNIPPAIKPSTYISNNQSNNQNPDNKLVDEKYTVKDGKIVTSNGTVIYTIPDAVIEKAGTTTPGWENTIINLVKMGNIPPVLNAIPMENSPGKYYLSANSFGNMENCEFSNRIYIFDSNTNDLTLMYEENNQTLSKDDPRACNSEIFLLATEGPKLILKYHTLKTSMLCDSAWSEPEKTYYLDVTKLVTESMRRYDIPPALTDAAEREEAACRATLQQ